MTSEEFGLEVERLRSDLYSFALSLCGSEEEAKDIVQDGILNALGALPRFENKNFKSWLFLIMRNKYYDNCRRSRKKVSTIEDYHSYSYGEVENNGLDNLIVDDINDALAKLSEKNREAIVLRALGFKYSEISELTESKLATVKARIKRARKKMDIVLRSPHY